MFLRNNKELDVILSSHKMLRNNKEPDIILSTHKMFLWNNKEPDRNNKDLNIILSTHQMFLWSRQRNNFLYDVKKKGKAIGVRKAFALLPLNDVVFKYRFCLLL